MPTRIKLSDREGQPIVIVTNAEVKALKYLIASSIHGATTLEAAQRPNNVTYLSKYVGILRNERGIKIRKESYKLSDEDYHSFKKYFLDEQVTILPTGMEN